MKAIFTSEPVASRFVREEYFPVRIDFGDQADYSRHVELVRGDTDLAEVATDPETGALRRILIVLCNHYRYEEGCVPVPACDEGGLLLEMPRVTECDAFELAVYEDGLRLALSRREAERRIRCGQAVLGFDACLGIVELLVDGLGPEDIAHIRRELEG